MESESGIGKLIVLLVIGQQVARQGLLRSAQLPVSVAALDLTASSGILCGSTLGTLRFNPGNFTVQPWELAKYIYSFVKRETYEPSLSAVNQWE